MDKELKEFIEEKVRTDACWEAYCADLTQARKCNKCDHEFETEEDFREHKDDGTLCPCCCSGKIVVIGVGPR